MQGVVRWIDLLCHLSERALGKLVINLFTPTGQTELRHREEI
jgi:hypothetical protein